MGSQNWLRIPSVIPLEIDTADADHIMELTVRNQYTTAQAVAMELDDGDAGDYMQVRINSQDRNFVLQVGEERKVTVELIIAESTLFNLNEDRKTVNFTVWARSETVSDAADAKMTVTMVRTAPVDTTDEEAEGGGAVRNVIMILLAAGVVVIGAFAVMRILGGLEEDAIDDWADDGYEGSLQATYAGVKSAPVIPTDAPPAGAPPTAPAPAATEAPAPAPAPAAASAAPPVPAEGLPEGWSMDQWQAYGQMWLEQNGRA